ncbi:MAG: potassium-transporting ATPase subunit KdpA [Alphaproteobacteria bacterium]|nr:potassium-transporting ATPase subunit KdpA [Alphaproteobacteria bacterium]
MTTNSIAQICLFLGLLILCITPLGSYMAKVFSGEKTCLYRIVYPVEKICYRLCGIDSAREMTWQAYVGAILIFTAAGFLVLYSIFILQAYLPLNPLHRPNLAVDLAFNAAVSFVTNTNWQSYAGERDLSYFSQMVGITTQHFISASVGIAVLMAVIRGLKRKKVEELGNFWVDVVRANLYLLLPLSCLLAVILGSQGVIQTFQSSLHVPFFEPIHHVSGKELRDTVISTQEIAVGPVASQIAIKQLGTNGGGYYNVNSSHPFENPTPVSNFFELLAMLLIPASLCHTFGKMIGDQRQGMAYLAIMLIVFIPLLFIGYGVEQGGNPKFNALNIDQLASDNQAGGNMEGKEVRFGIIDSTMFAAITTASANGAVNSMHDSYTPLGGMIPLLFMHFGEVIFGGVGSGVYGMLAYVIITVFLAGLMVGRTPEYLGKKISVFEMKMAMIAVLTPCATILIGVTFALLTQAGKDGIFNPGAQGFTEILYSFTSAAANNGSAFAGIKANNVFYNLVLGLIMLIGRFSVIISMLALAGSLAQKQPVPPSAGTLPTHRPLFVFFVIGVVILVGVLTFFPVLALGPIAEQLNSTTDLIGRK